MTRIRTRSLVTTVLVGVCALVAFLVLGSTVFAAGTTYYVDCAAGSNGSGSQSSPWNSLTTVSATTFAAGDSILLKRGTTCVGNVWPKGSGSSGAPITLGAYGTGPKPIISAGSNEYAVRLYDQQYWRIESIETTGGTRYGIFVAGSVPGATLNHFRITDVTVHDVSGGTMDKKSTGLIVFKSGDKNWDGFRFNDVVIDGATVYNTSMWGGIMFYGDVNRPTDQSRRSTNITIRNSTASNVQGDGIVIFVANNGLIENSVAYDTGNQPTQTIGTPNGIWTWACKDCIVQTSESYANDSPGVDGGGFDIDYHNENNTYQYNYGHNNSTYCISVFGADGATTINSVIRYNVCANNGLQVSGGSPPQDIHFLTWGNGSIDGVQIYNNTFYTTRGVLSGSGTWVGSRPRFFKNNLIYATNSNPLGSNISAISRDYNLYYATAGNYNSGEANSVHANPLLNNPTYNQVGRPTSAFTLQAGSPAINAGTNVCAGISGCSTGGRDFFGNSAPQGGSYDIGAHESGGAMPTPTATGGPTATPAPTATATPAPTNLLGNPGFESGSTNPWTFWPSGAGSLVGSGQRSGSYAAKVTSTNAGTYQVVSGLSPNTMYTARAYLRAGGSGTSGYLYAKNFGGSTVTSATVTGSSYTLVTVTFTTGTSNTSAEIGVWRPSGGGSGDFFLDDLELQP